MLMSKFKHKIRRSWIAVCLLTATLVFAIIGGWENTVAFDDHSHHSVLDNALLWSKARKNAQSLGKDGLIVVGSSRAQLGTDLYTLEKVLNKPCVQLAVDGGVFFEVLQDLANDPKITGTVLVDASITDFFQRYRAYDTSKEWLAHFHGMQNHADFFYENLEDKLSETLNALLPGRAMGAKPYEQGLTVFLSGSEFSNYLQTLPNRMKRADFTKANSKSLFENQYAQAKLDEIALYGTSVELLAQVEKTAQAVAKITARGGKVVFVRYPISNTLYEFEQKNYPKNMYWDVIVKNHIGARAIHFQDIPGMKGFTFPDGVHLDFRETSRFTQSLAQAIR